LTNTRMAMYLEFLNINKTVPSSIPSKQATRATPIVVIVALSIGPIFDIMSKKSKSIRLNLKNIY
jgi:hypothetical protein